MIDEWNVVTVIIAIVGLIGTVAVPLGKNTKAMTKLHEQLSHLTYRMSEDEKDLKEFKEKASDRHKKLFDTLDVHSDKLNDHEARINTLERKD